MPKSVNPLRRTSSSPFSSAQRKKPGSRTTGKEDAAERLDDIGGVPTLVPNDARQDVVSLIRYIQEHTFEDIPDRSAGMNSTQMSQTRSYREALPPVVSIAHLQALSASSTSTEREMARLVAMGKVRKVTVPGRGKGGSVVGEGVVMVEDWKQCIHQEQGIEDELKAKYVTLMDAHPTSATTPVFSLSDEETKRLVAAGFFTSPGALSSTVGNLFARPSDIPGGTIARAGYSAATGTLAAIGGSGAIHNSGGSGSVLATKDNRSSRAQLSKPEMTFSLPNTGPYLKLLTEARLHLLYLLKQLSPRYKEATKAFLREKWDGNVPDDLISIQKRMRGEFKGVLPGRTKRWREFYGLEFEWVLAECVGSGLMELFDTGSVGIAVRAI